MSDEFRIDLSDKQTARLATDFLTCVLKGLIADGTLNPEGRSDAEIEREFRVQLSRLAKADDIFVSIDHRQDILTRARDFQRRKEFEIAFLFYATWFEHWINSLILHICSTKSIDEETYKMMVRDIGLRTKYIGLPRLAGMPAISAAHIKTVVRISELRNGYVHYKNKPIRIDDLGNDKEGWQQELVGAERAVKYLRDYESRYVYTGHKRRVAKLVSVMAER